MDTTRMRATLVGVVLTVKVTGPVDLKQADVIRHFIKREALSHGARAVLADMRGSVYLYSATERLALSRATVTSPDRVDLPMIYLVSPVDRAEVLAHCIRVRRHGLFRVVTADEETANELALMAASWLPDVAPSRSSVAVS